MGTIRFCKVALGVFLAVFPGVVATAAAADYTMKISYGDPALPDNVEHFLQTGLKQFERDVESLSNGAVDVKIFWSGQLGKEDNVVNLVRNGQVEAMIASDGHVAAFFPDIQVLGKPYLFVSRDVAHKVFDGEFGTYLADRLAAEAGIRPLPWLEGGGYRNFSASTPLNTADDLKGLKIRTMNNPVHMQIVRSLGASPTPVSFSDLYTALQTGVVDGQENSLATFRNPRLEEVQKHIILDGHVYAVNMLLVSEKWLQSLPEPVRQAVQTAADSYKKTNRELSVKLEQSDIEYLRGAGVTIVDVSPEEKKKFQQMTQEDAVKALEAKVTPAAMAKLNEAVAAAEKN